MRPIGATHSMANDPPERDIQVPQLQFLDDIQIARKVAEPAGLHRELLRRTLDLLPAFRSGKFYNPGRQSGEAPEIQMLRPFIAQQKRLHAGKGLIRQNMHLPLPMGCGNALDHDIDFSDGNRGASAGCHSVETGVAFA